MINDLIGNLIEEVSRAGYRRAAFKGVLQNLGLAKRRFHARDKKGKNIKDAKGDDVFQSRRKADFSKVKEQIKNAIYGKNSNREVSSYRTIAAKVKPLPDGSFAKIGDERLETKRTISNSRSGLVNQFKDEINDIQSSPSKLEKIKKIVNLVRDPDSKKDAEHTIMKTTNFHDPKRLINARNKFNKTLKEIERQREELNKMTKDASIPQAEINKANQKLTKKREEHDENEKRYNIISSITDRRKKAQDEYLKP
jgi:hypothetical protein